MRTVGYGPIIRARRFRLLHLRHEWGQWVVDGHAWGTAWYWDYGLFERSHKR